MVIIGDSGVRYFNKLGNWVLATDGRDIPQEEYDRMPGWERYSVLCAFAEAGDEPVRYND